MQANLIKKFLNLNWSNSENLEQIETLRNAIMRGLSRKF